MKNILVSIDLNNDENLLIDKAIEIAHPFDAKIWLLHVAAPEPQFIGFGVGPQYIRDDRANELRKEHRLISTYTDLIRNRNQKCEGLLINGATIEMILEEAHKLDIDLIIIGHHDHNFLYNAFFGNITNGVIKKANIPVLIVPLSS